MKIFNSKRSNNVINKCFDFGRITLELNSNNAIMYILDGKYINWFFSSAFSKDGRSINTKTALMQSFHTSSNDEGYILEINYKENGLILTQNFSIKENDTYFTLNISLKDENDKIIESNHLNVMDFPYPRSDCHQMFLSLNERMLRVPFDNDMWSHYESVYLECGRTSYDVTAIFDCTNYNGLLIGAIDFDIWKNAIKCSSYDARSFSVISGISDAGTHDTLEHGYIEGKEIVSSRFICGFYPNINDGLLEYANLIKSIKYLPWPHETIFGWNSYSALTMDFSLDNLKVASDFFANELTNFRTKDNTVYLNIDDCDKFSKQKLTETIKYIHSKGQKVGTYLAPVCMINRLENERLKGSLFKHRKDIILKTPDGKFYNRVDDKYPIDITIPEAEKDLRLTLQEIVKLGFDYLKFDFLSHGCLEGTRYNKSIKTGRQALNYFYNIVLDELNPEKIGRDIFISTSIAPLFPNGFAHGRRCSCDSFGHIEDVNYVLNALTFGYWINENLYQYSDPDHTVLYKSIVDGRDVSSLFEARSRFNSSLISGTIMLLSDNYGPNDQGNQNNEVCQRALQIANNKYLNEIAYLNKAFRPLELKNDNNIFFLNENDISYIAVFNFFNKKTIFSIDTSRITSHHGNECVNLNTMQKFGFSNNIKIELDGYDSVILKID